jgi:hypothetical protein
VPDAPTNLIMAKGAKTVRHQLAHGTGQRKSASATEQCAQFGFQSTV